MAIPQDKIVYTTTPYPVAMHEGQRVSALVKKYGDRLINSDIDQVHLDTIFEQAGAFAHCVGVMDSFVKMSETHKKIYQEKKDEGCNTFSLTLINLSTFRSSILQSTGIQITAIFCDY